MINVLLVDDHELVRAGIRRILEDIKGIKVVGEASCGEDAVKWCRTNAVDVVLMDMSMPGIGGLEATRKIARSTADVKIIMLTVHTENPLPAKVMQAGAAGYLSKVETAEEVYHEIELQAQQLEYDYYSLCVRHPVPFTRPKVAFYTNYPEAWVSYYQAKNFLAIDPVLNPENFSQGHLMWNDDLFSEAQPLWEAARAHGLRRGVTQYLMLPNRALGFLSFSRCSAREIPILSDELQLKMQLLVRESLMALMRLNDEIVMTPEMNFSKREKEILRWTAEGKTSAEIAMILSISENTVNFHQKNMQKKINAPNKTQVACYAAATGLI